MATFGAVSTFACRRTVGTSAHHLCQSALFVPMTNVSMRFGPHETAAGALVRTPPRLSQPLQPFSYHLCHMRLSVPRTKTSSLPELHELAPGPDVRTPPRLSQPSQVIAFPLRRRLDCRPTA